MKRTLLELPGLKNARDVEDFGSRAPQGQLQLSQALLGALERLRARFGVSFELPGVEPVTTRIGTKMPGRTVRVPADTEELGWASPEALIVPLSVESAGDWMLIVGGATPAEVDEIFDPIGTAMAAHLHRLAVDRCAAARKELSELLMASGRAPELAVVGALRWLMDRASASSGVVTLCEGAGVRELAAIGAFGSGTSIPPVRSRTSPSGLVFPLQLGAERTVVIELRADERRPFAQEVLPILREAVELLRLWLAGNVDALREPLAAENMVDRTQRAYRGAGSGVGHAAHPAASRTSIAVGGGPGDASESSGDVGRV
jgi:hypothetical protein